MKKTFTFKHIVISFAIGALLMVSGQALADTVSQIGKKVDSEAAVYVNGNKVSDAIIIKGKSYAPARDIAETLGAKVEWKGSDGILITSNNELVFEEIHAHSKAKANVQTTQEKIDRIETSINKVNSDIEQHQGIYKQFLEERLSDLTKELEEEKANLEKYEQELADLEASK